jgi:hypothetical protein
MDTSNPFPAPRSEKALASEKKFASRLLSSRDSRQTLGTFYRMQAKVLAILLVAFGLAIGYFAWLNLLPGVYLMLGGLFGVLVRDFGIIRAQLRLWPMQQRVLDWHKVQRMAQGADYDL